MLRVQDLVRVTVQQDLEALPPARAQGHDEAPRPLRPRRHRLRRPGVPRARDAVALLRHLALLEAPAALGPEEDLAARVRGGQVRLRHGLGHVAPDDDVGVAARLAPARDARVRTLQVVLEELVRDERRPLAHVDVDVQVENSRVYVRQHHAVLGGQGNLQYTRHPRRLQLVGQGRLGADQRHGRGGVEALGAGGPQGLGGGDRLHGVGHDHAVGVELAGVHVQRRNVGLPDALRDDLLHGHPVRRGDVGPRAGLVAGDACEDAEELLAVHDGPPVNDVGQRLEHERRGTIAADVSVGAAVEREGPARHREHFPGAVVQECPEVRLQVVRGGEGERDRLPIADPREVGARHGHRDQGRRALEVDGNAGALHAVDEGKAAASDTPRAAANARTLLLGLAPLLVRRARDVHAAPGAQELLLLVASPPQGLVARLQDHAVTRVHASRLDF
mmetsp:Transcript_85034/g.259721  ORF Transcript_85034/g.259721 Transcript_85034/m.259721 type:complete len:447 (+) Transcript_85034:1057-2397(+)